MIGLLVARLWLVVELSSAIAAVEPTIPRERVASASIGIALEHGDHDPLLVAAIAIGESKLDWRAVNARGCAGPMQVCGRGRYRTERAGYRAGVKRLDEARAYCARRRTPTLRCQLAAFAGGPRLVRAGTYRGRAVLARRDRLRAAIGSRPSPAAQIGGDS